MTEITALLDACVLYSAPLRDLLMNLAIEDLFHAKWTDAIHEEWIQSLLENRADLNRKQLQRTKDLMNRAAPDATVTGYERRIKQLVLPDPTDRHVVAAAIQASAELIVTYNIRHFPRHTLRIHGLEAIHPDKFMARLLRLDEDAVCIAVKRQRENLRNPPKSIEAYLETMEQQGLKNTVAALHRLTRLI